MERPWQENRLVKSVRMYCRQNRVLISTCLIFLLFLVVRGGGRWSLLQQLNQVSHIAVVAAGMTVVVLAGEVDLSMGAVAAFASVMYAWLVAGGVWDVAAVAVTLLLCLALGAVNGALVGLCRLPGFLITLLLSGGVSALSQTVSKGVSIGISLADKRLIGLIRARVLGIPVPLLIVLAVYVIVAVMMNSTKLGRSICAVGGNPGAARMSGLKPGWVKFRVFLVSAVCAGLGGIMFTLRLEAGIHTLGSGWEVDALAAVILGGANIRTGEGSVSATFLGLLLICFIKNLLTGTDWLYQWQSPVTIVLIVILLLAENRRAEGRLLRY